MLQANDQSVIDGYSLQPDRVQPTGLWKIETLNSLADMRNHAHAWLALERECIDPLAAFQSYAWCKSWAAAFCGKKNGLPQPRIFFISRGETLVAILPMMVSTHMGAKVLTLFGEPHSQIANAITMAGVDCRDGLRLCIAQAAMLTDADVVALGPLPENTILTEALDTSLLSPDPADVMSMVTWPGIWQAEDYIAGLKKNRRKDYNRKLNRLKSHGTINFERFQAGSSEFKAAVRDALVLKREWLVHNGMVSAGLSSGGVDIFLQGIVPFEGGFEMEAEVLKSGNKTIAIGINLVGRNMRHCYLSTYSDAYSEVSPGTMLHQFSIQQSINDGMNCVNFLGYPTHFKTLWTTKKTPLFRYQDALSLRGKIWLQLWIGIIRPLVKSGLLALRKLTRLPIIGKLLKSVLGKISPPDNA
ncbi:MAG: GNAT family N-acetyltransferase [Rhizobiaceae bacterium]